MSAPGADDGEDALMADLAEFVTHDRKGGWALAHLIARRVEKDTGHGVGAEQAPRKPFDRTVSFRKISASEFARRTGTTHKRVLAFLLAWDRAVADRVVPSRAELAVGVAVDLPDEADIPFYGEGGYYRSFDTMHMSKQRRESIETASAETGVKPVTTAYVVQHPGAVETAMLASETSRAAARKGLKQFEARQAASDRQDRDAAASVAKDKQAKADRAARPVGGVEVDGSIEVFNALAEARSAAQRALTLASKKQTAFNPATADAVGELCDSVEAAISAIRDIAAGSVLDDAALAAFLDESGKFL